MSDRITMTGYRVLSETTDHLPVIIHTDPVSAAQRRQPKSLHQRRAGEFFERNQTDRMIFSERPLDKRPLTARLRNSPF
jgi:hypothetical protein